jgi:hypothetical protein
MKAACRKARACARFTGIDEPRASKSACSFPYFSARNDSRTAASGERERRRDGRDMRMATRLGEGADDALRGVERQQQARPLPGPALALRERQPERRQRQRLQREP